MFFWLLFLFGSRTQEVGLEALAAVVRPLLETLTGYLSGIAHGWGVCGWVMGLRASESY